MGWGSPALHTLARNASSCWELPRLLPVVRHVGAALVHHPHVHQLEGATAAAHQLQLLLQAAHELAHTHTHTQAGWALVVNSNVKSRWAHLRAPRSPARGSRLMLILPQHSVMP